MDSLITAAARALALGDPLAALQRIALRDDAPALALRGIAMAQLGEFGKARALVKRARLAFGARESIARARCVVAEAEIALASRELNWPVKQLETARIDLLAHGDTVNAMHARHLQIQRLLLIGRIEAAEELLTGLDSTELIPAQAATLALIRAGIAMRRLRTQAAHTALEAARHHADQAGIPALRAEVGNAFKLLNAPVANLIKDNEVRPLCLHEVEAWLTSDALIVDACRYAVRNKQKHVLLATRPILFTLARALAHAGPRGASRDELIASAFRTKHSDESHRVRLRVELGRLRKLLHTMAEITSTKSGFVLNPLHATEVVVLARPVEEKHAPVLAFLADGEAWSSSSLALALGSSQRQVQRALEALASAGKVQAYGQGRARKWMTPPMPGFATTLLLPVPLISE